MKLAVVTVVVLTASFSLVSAQSATTDPAAACPKVDVTKTAPPPTTVNVLNFPEVQAVTGTVSVENLPAVQTVGGSVDVGNLLLDTNGAVRVTTASALPYQRIELLSQLVAIPPGGGYVTPSVVTKGYSRVAVRFEGSTGYRLREEWRWEGDDDFGSVLNAGVEDPGQCYPVSPDDRITCSVSGIEMRVSIQNTAGVPILFSSIRVYLFPQTARRSLA